MSIYFVVFNNFYILIILDWLLVDLPPSLFKVELKFYSLVSPASAEIPVDMTCRHKHVKLYFNTFRCSSFLSLLAFLIPFLIPFLLIIRPMAEFHLDLRSFCLVLSQNLERA
ncbi:hypothetical protein ACH5RR_006649 [Cinchona calisaya]|uniref:Uncharacterized protein n=1 Tax=Cinchona calisaya TaxID=153742 RepID=A0ABD3APM1_9GENT